MLARHFGTVALLATFVGSSCDCRDEIIPVVDRGAVRGLICADVDGQVREGLAVKITDASGNTYDAVTDAAGMFLTEEIGVGIATVVITDAGVERQGTISVNKDVIVQFTDSSCREPPIPPTPVGSVHGCVCDEAVGQWVAGGNVYIQTADGGIFASVTLDDGCFVLEGVPAGSYTLAIDKGVFRETHEVTVVVDQVAELPVVATCEPPVVPENAGAVSGRVCAPDGETWLSGAEVYILLSTGQRVTVTTDADGRYVLNDVPPGRHTLNIVKGSFSSSSVVDVFADQTTSIPEDECTIAPVGLRVAVVTGNFDHVQDVLTSIGVEAGNIDLYESSQTSFSTWVDELLLAPGVLDQYDIVFLNCGLQDKKFYGDFRSQPAIDKLRAFVAGGKSVYASDWAYNIVEAVWPEYIDFVGDESPNAGKNGTVPFNIDASIVDASMATALGQTSMELHYPSPGSDGWVVMNAVSAQTTVYVSADASTYDYGLLRNVPHTVAFRPGAGRVLFTSFHQEAGINPDMQRILQLLMFEL